MSGLVVRCIGVNDPQVVRHSAENPFRPAEAHLRSGQHNLAAWSASGNTLRFIGSCFNKVLTEKTKKTGALASDG
jgi:hypothetical protein